MGASDARGKIARSPPVSKSSAITKCGRTASPSPATAAARIPRTVPTRRIGRMGTAVGFSFEMNDQVLGDDVPTIAAWLAS
jgi:hypothetical protein